LITGSLQSGSNGNSIYVEAGGVKLLFDAGISGALAEERLSGLGRDIRDCQALLISHDHIDHAQCAGVFQRKFGLPIYITAPTHRALGKSLGKLHDVRHFRSGERLSFGPVTVYTVPTPHDAVDGVAFVVEHERRRLGILTDLGHPFSGLERILSGLDAAYLESNYDPAMLEAGPYSPELKARIKGQGGHLSNGEAALLAKGSCRSRLSWLAMAHLSEENNHPELAVHAHRSQIGRLFPLYLAPRHGPGPLLTV
jgi:phosphoribosyl 1,2-cyclic phosphodiesterase